MQDDDDDDPMLGEHAAAALLGLGLLGGAGGPAPAPVPVLQPDAGHGPVVAVPQGALLFVDTGQQLDDGREVLRCAVFDEEACVFDDAGEQCRNILQAWVVMRTRRGDGGVIDL